MMIEISQNETLTLQEKVRNIVNARLRSCELNDGYLTVKGLAALLKKDERTIRRWNSLRLKGNKNIGLAFHQDNPHSPIIYYLEEVYAYFVKTMF